MLTIYPSCTVTHSPSILLCSFAFFWNLRTLCSASGSIACVGCIVRPDDIFSGTWLLLLFIDMGNVLDPHLFIPFIMYYLFVEYVFRLMEVSQHDSYIGSQGTQSVGECNR